MTDPDPDDDAVADAIRDRVPVYLDTATWKARLLKPAVRPGSGAESTQ